MKYLATGSLICPLALKVLYNCPRRLFHLFHTFSSQIISWESKSIEKNSQDGLSESLSSFSWQINPILSNLSHLLVSQTLSIKQHRVDTYSVFPSAHFKALLSSRIAVLRHWVSAASLCAAARLLVELELAKVQLRIHIWISALQCNKKVVKMCSAVLSAKKWKKKAKKYAVPFSLLEHSSDPRGSQNQ